MPDYSTAFAAQFNIKNRSIPGETRTGSSRKPSPKPEKALPPVARERALKR